MYVEPQRKTKHNKNNNVKSSWDDIEEVDPNLNLRENRISPKNHIKSSERGNIKKLLSLELLNEILQSPSISNDEKEKINNLMQKVSDSKYYYCYGELDENKSNIIRVFEEREKIIERPILIRLPEELDYDVEFYKIGKTCNALKKRYAIIKRGGFYSSKKPIIQMDRNKLKDKTDYLPGSEVIIETKDNMRKSDGEWSNKDKKYRIRINYSLVAGDDSPKNLRSFFLYFDDERKMKEVEIMLFGITLTEHYKKLIRKHLRDTEFTMTQGNAFYTILKILSLKNKIKQRKITFNKIRNQIQGEIFGKLNIEKKLLKRLSLQRRETMRNNFLKKEPPKQEPVLYKKPPKLEKIFENQYSDFMPIISNVSINCGKISYKNPKLRDQKKSLNDLINKYKSLKNEIPRDIIKNNTGLSDDGICFNISNGVQVKKDDRLEDSNNENKSFKLDPTLCNKCNYIYFDKNQPEIKFKVDNNNYEDENNPEQNILSGKNIYEISNVVLNSNINLREPEENNLVIIGPKIDNNIEIRYGYKNDKNLYSDPENVKLKSQTVNFCNKQEISGITLQIYQSELDINDESIQNLLKSLTGSIALDPFPINQDKIKEYLLFGYRIKLNEFKYIDSPFVQPNYYKNNICFIEYNHQYFIPREYLKDNSKLVIECFCLPKMAYSNKENLIPEDKKGYIGKLLAPVNIGHIILNYELLKEGKYKYNLENNGDIEPNSFILIDGGKDIINNINLKNIQGKDYSVGCDSYIIKTINKEFIEKARNNPDIPDEIKNKYFNVCFDDETENNFLFRPNEDMDENDFIRDISDNNVSNEEIQMIKNNKKYHFLPYCEKYIDEATLKQSQNLKCLSDEQKDYIIKNYHKGDWIYKIPEIKVKLLSKNLGVIKAYNELSQLVYGTKERQSLSIDSLSKDEEAKIIPLTENNFNIFDMKEIQKMENFDNFQWKTSIKFNNPLQMNTFLKLLTLARQNINSKKKHENDGNEFDSQKIEYFDNQKNEDIENLSQNNRNGFKISKLENKCAINIEFIDFREDFQLEKDPTLLEVLVFIEGQVGKTILLLLKDQTYGFENSLLTTDEKIRNAFNKYGKKGKKELFPKKVKLSKKKFNNGQKKIILGDHLKTEIDFDKKNIQNHSYEIDVILNGNGEYFSPLDMKQIMNNKMCNKLELPLYKKGENSKIYACLGLDLYEVDDSGKSFQQRYEELNSSYLREPLLLLKEQLISQDFQLEKYHMGLYEPNIFRRKILNFIHNEQNISVDPNDMENNIHKDLDILYPQLIMKCVVLPSREQFSSFKFYDIKKNFEGHYSYKRKLGLKFLTITRHEKFMQVFRQREWDLYLYKISKGDLKGINYFMNINDKKILLNNKNEANKLHDLIFMGIPSLEYRKVIYTTLLETGKLYEKTRELLFQKYQKDLNNPQQVFNFFADQLFENDKGETNLIFSLIDNDSTFISSLGNTSLEDINSIKKIAKSFFIWSDLRIGLTKNEDKYVYFIGLLSITQKLRLYFQEDYFVFWLLIGLSQYMTHFHQQNPLFTDEMNYINIYGLVTKLILESHQKKIYDKFISLNFPPEFFLSMHLSALYTDYFKDELMMRIFDILIFESSFQGLYGDNLQYLRILCAIPITLFELSKNRILVCKSVSEIESIFNDLILKTFNYNKFIFTLEKNVNKFYVMSNFLEKWLFNNRGREWDAKRDELQNLIYQHFIPIYKDNTSYLFPISLHLNNDAQKMYNLYFENLDSKLSSIKSLYGQGTTNFDDSNSVTGITVHISKLQQIYNNDRNIIDEYKLVLSFGDTSNEIGQNYPKLEVGISFDCDKNKINNISDLFFKESFQGNKLPKYLHFALTDNQYNIMASFVYQLLNYEPMKISKIALENKEENRKFFLEFVLFRYTTKALSGDDIALFNRIFSSPEYVHSKPIEEKLYSYSISNYSFNKNITQLIRENNNNRNFMVTNSVFDENLIEMFKNFNNNEEEEDKYNIGKLANIKNSSPFNGKIHDKVISILDYCLQENIHHLAYKWITSSNLSIEEMLYSIILIDRSLISINEKLFLLYSIAQTKDRLLFNNDDLSISKMKEMIYSLYKRFMIYFTKTDVERMIDFLIKDERLFNIKYAFVYNKICTEKINDFIYDKDYYEPKLANKKPFEIYFDDISKQLNIFLSHLNNHYNITTLSKNMLLYALTKILNNLDLTKYIQYKLDRITLVIEKDNLLFKRTFVVEYSPLKITEEYDPLFEVNPKNQEDNFNIELCYEISSFDTKNSYSINNYISFDKFKEIFFKLPYLSDLFRVSFSYISENKNTFNKEFNDLKVTIGYEDYYHGIFYFPQNLEENNIENEYEGNIGYQMNKKVKISDTIDHIISDIYNKINNKVKMNNNEMIIRDFLKSIDKISCYVCYYLNEKQKDGIIKEKIGYFDSLYSCIELKNKNIVEIQIIFNNDLLTFNSSKRTPVPRKPGYCKIFYSNNNEFVWKKCRVKAKDIKNAKLTSCDYKTLPNIENEDDVVLAFNI